MSKKQSKNQAKKTEIKFPSGKSWFYKLVRVFMPLIFKKPQIINLAGELPDKAIVVVNHSAKSGPPGLDIWYPKTTCKWGTHEMFEGFKSRKAYLRDILYIKKCGMKPGAATSFKASVLGFLNPPIYRGMRMIPTYTDARFSATLRVSADVLDQNLSVMIFPENSNEGYKDVLTDFFPGFVMLAQSYFRKTGEDVPVYPVYYSVKKRILVIAPPMYVQDMVKEGLNKFEIAQRYCDAVNKLYYDYVERA